MVRQAVDHADVGSWVLSYHAVALEGDEPALVPAPDENFPAPRGVVRILAYATASKLPTMRTLDRMNRSEGMGKLLPTLEWNPSHEIQSLDLLARWGGT